MTSQPFDFTPSKPQDSETGGGLAIAGMLMLPEAEQQLITWMIRQGEVTVAEAIAYTGRDEATVRQMLNTLLQAGFLQTSERSGITHYSRAAFAAKPGRQLDAQIWQSLAPGSPLAVIRNPSGDLVVVAGSPPIDLCITLSNQGNQSALIDVFLDESQPVYSWCLNPRDRLALGPQQSGEVVFQFQVPVQTVPSLYTYSLVVDAPDHYPEDTPIQFTQRLQVLPPIQEAMRVHDPSFVLQPATSSTKPAALQPGQTLEVFVFVHNRSNRVDRFRLTCPDLPETWFTIRYPEGLDTPGLVLETDGLALNPDGRGQILLLIHPPIAAPAGVYSPNVQLHSANLPDLVLMDLVYVQILPAYFLNIELRTLLGRVRRGIGQYEIRLLNEGNTDRAVQLHIEAADEEDLCVYTLEPASVLVLPPKSSTTLNLQVEPTKWWRRPLYGGGRLINFFVEVSDQQQLPLPNDRFRETLIWEPRPWWQFWLLVLTVLGSVAAIVFLLWWIVFRPPAVPKIVEFSSDDPAYQEANGDFIRLNWQIRNPDQIQAIRLTSQSPEGGAASKPITYSFSQGIPGELKEYCVVQQLLICKGVRTDARKVGNYLFELAVIPKQGEAVDTQKIGPVQIQSTQPAIVFFRIDGKDITSNSKYLVPLNPKQPIKQINLTWQIAGGSDVKVELLPTPGTVRSTGAIVYSLTPKPTSETFTLKVSNAAGATITRSITIESYEPPPATRSLKPSLPGTPKLIPPTQNLPIVPIPAPPNLPSSLPTLTPLPVPSQPAASPSEAPELAPVAPTGSPPPASTPNPTAPAPTDPDSLSPSELPPKFN